MTASLNEQLLAAHATQDKAALVRLYGDAAKIAPNDRVRGYYLTFAYVFALEINDPATSHLHAQLCAIGCDQ